MAKNSARTVLGFGVLLGACGGAEPDGPTEAFYFEHIEPIIEAKCVRCHEADGIAPFAFGDYASARAHAGVSLLAIDENIMPPWLAGDGCNDYWGDYSLTDEEKALWRVWVETDTPMGDKAHKGQMIPVEDLRLSNVDVVIPMEEPYTPQKTPDDYRCFLVDWPTEFETTQYVTGFRAVPGNIQNVHHIIAFLGDPSQRAEYEAKDASEPGPGYTCFGGTGGSIRSWLGAWAPGGQGNDMAEGTGIRVLPGSFLVVQVHYNTLTEEASSDRSSIEVSVADSVRKEVHVQPWTNPFWLDEGGMPIPANKSDVSHGFAFDPTPFISGGEAMTVYGVALHMHNLGRTARLSIFRNAGGEECLLDIPRWDFDWQGGYALRKPVVIEPGDRLNVECSWSNTMADQPIVDGRPLPPRDVEWGEGTQDEMCLGLVTWSL